MKQLHLIDFQNMMYRYSNAMHLSVVYNGVTINTSALYGLVKYCKSLKAPTIFCLEGYPKLFKSYYPEYKGTRNSEKEEEVTVPLADVISIASVVAAMQGIYCRFCFSPNQEADQVVASLSKAVFNKRLQLFQSEEPSSDFYWKRLSKLEYHKLDLPDGITDVLIKTTDSDMYQLIDEQVSLTNNLADNEGTRKTPKAVHHIAHYSIPVYKAFVGDVSDNVPNLVKEFPKDRFLKIIEDIITDTKELDEFITKTRVGVPYPGAEDLQNYLQKHKTFKQLVINRNITTLTFYSMPWSVTPPDSYDLPSVLKKYKVRL